jgi:putative redox protein
LLKRATFNPEKWYVMTVLIRRRPALEVGFTVHVGEHEFVADVSHADGGNDAGPNPHDLYDAALGACKALTVMLYTRRKGIAVEDIEVVVERDASGERSGAYALNTRLRIRGAVSDSQLRELEAVAHKCPIHKLMTVVTTMITTHVERLP